MEFTVVLTPECGITFLTNRVCIHKIKSDVSVGYLSSGGANKILVLCKRVHPYLDDLYNCRHILS